MDNRKVSYKEILLIIGYVVIIVAYKFVDQSGFIPEDSLLGIFMGFLAIISITLTYLVFVQKEPFSRILYHIKKIFPYLIIIALISFVIIVALPFFVSIKSKLFNLVVLLVVTGSAVLSLGIILILSKRGLYYPNR